MKVVIIVDTQKDFDTNGVLGTPEAHEAVLNCAKLIEENANEDTILLTTQDTHYSNYLDTAEGKKLPIPHCIYQTEGWELCDIVEKAILDNANKYKEVVKFYKETFGSDSLMNYLRSLAGRITDITLAGLDTDICVISNGIIAKTAVLEARVQIAEDCCAGTSPESHNRALEAMKMCQIEVI